MEIIIKRLIRNFVFFFLIFGITLVNVTYPFEPFFAVNTYPPSGKSLPTRYSPNG
nr:MAG TPA: hypothetical protein [Caudoviricetes sp.]